ncbi:hypothetical protein LCGC14_1549760 [marine sediment metagenome]|uniref:Uncharacterized protein n=1 Tax=marine sediment metagenome TaxID=412755 RepID=A0A0F9L6M5_9ZZZZ
MNKLQKLDIKLGEWASVVHFRLRFTRSLDECDKWLTPKFTAGQGGIEFRYYPGCARCIITVQDESGFSTYEGVVKVSSEGEAQKCSALALCLAVEKLIDSQSPSKSDKEIK